MSEFNDDRVDQLHSQLGLSAGKKRRKGGQPRSSLSSLTNETLGVVIPALFNIPRRAERRSGEAIRRTFVDLGAMSASLSSEEHQIVYGRRGTGKTHALENLAQTLREKERTVVTVDLRTIGSAGSYYLVGDDGIAIGATRVIVDLLEEVHQQILSRCVELIDAEFDASQLVRHLDAFGDASCSVEIVGTTESTLERSTGATAQHGLRASASSRPELALEAAETLERTRAYRRTQAGVERFSLKFGPISRSVQGIVRGLPDQTLWVILDEWSALPLKVQPLVADFLRRCFLPVEGVVVKVAAIHGRSQFSRYGGGSYVGLELGADIMQDLDLDEYLAWSARDQRAEEFFRSLFCRHIAEYWRNEGFGLQPDDLRYKIYGAIPDFQYLVMAAGGVPRDAINVAAMAAQDSGQLQIKLQHIGAATRRWFLNDKESQIRPDHASRRVLQSLRTYAESNHRRGFLLDRHHDARATEIQDLYDSRIIHRIASGVGPGARYEAYLLDFGLYADIVSDSDSLQGWRENWMSSWRDFDPTKAPEVRQAILSVEDLRRVIP